MWFQNTCFGVLGLKIKVNDGHIFRRSTFLKSVEMIIIHVTEKRECITNPKC